MSQIFEAIIPHIPGAALNGDALELRRGTHYLRFRDACLIFASGVTEQAYELNDPSCLSRLAAELRAAGIENTLDAR